MADKYRLKRVTFEAVLLSQKTAGEAMALAAPHTSSIAFEHGSGRRLKMTMQLSREPVDAEPLVAFEGEWIVETPNGLEVFDDASFRALYQAMPEMVRN